MKQRLRKRSAFALVETTMVLGLVSLLMLLGVAFPKNQEGQEWRTFEKQVMTAIELGRHQAQAANEPVFLDFTADALRLAKRTYPYPRRFVIEKPIRLSIAKSGFISPQSVYWSNGQKRIRLVIQFGGGHVDFKAD
ncbi:hypothetical protein [Fructobacillus parabroussonetiae]|uniref:Prepilin-type N-terminal cleavage/methylation domain-containing protein n=1 Tax=Fructobacillus parabroussonetiae TaxID=2713174 RepID=A0ABS5R1E3_9LACO|nr:hypothetical protein [Fructobacillus parabroussonetiae]MBS9337977.1 hypothetical protein [Fructobacillus parabroussonetiae]